MIKEQLQFAFLEYFNNYLSIEKYAIDFNLTKDEAERLIELGREVHERIVNDLKESEG